MGRPTVPRRPIARKPMPLSTRMAICGCPPIIVPLTSSWGTWAVAADASQGSQELHVVYASPGTIAAYRKDEHFPDGSVLVKEVFEAETGAMTTGTVSHARTLQGWFVMVKDRNNSHPDNPLWGDGWGWSWFDAANPSETTSTDYGADCKGCHVPAEATEWVYVEGYPPLKR